MLSRKTKLIKIAMPRIAFFIATNIRKKEIQIFFRAFIFTL
ncbi:hypothetical protein CAPGI0001_0924 [Capnocytophaga gingivalis ATCC 33624]|nr:hypothetical protein CAPGI0001_0924 [Capnocytophaga gingivalis ATCC 33624]